MSKKSTKKARRLLNLTKKQILSDAVTKSTLSSSLVPLSPQKPELFSGLYTKRISQNSEQETVFVFIPRSQKDKNDPTAVSVVSQETGVTTRSITEFKNSVEAGIYRPLVDSVVARDNLETKIILNVNVVGIIASYYLGSLFFDELIRSFIEKSTNIHAMVTLKLEVSGWGIVRNETVTTFIGGYTPPLIRQGNLEIKTKDASSYSFSTIGSTNKVEDQKESTPTVVAFKDTTKNTLTATVNNGTGSLEQAVKVLASVYDDSDQDMFEFEPHGLN